ncbi:flagellar biosynthesis protein FliQ [Lachnospiraceae bacterium JLR.KK009]|jgi:flagellar biosynthetic protein FliQ|nr:flagellar biosynthetic protein FliQ [Lachnospiraceae bacterium A2]MCI8705853.1 flagellar biosynthesis protein FliQ [Lachnospiraceae bacterium]MCI8881809.1 flagellar biosynthesis protein FliQ [Lachnospiraceae bacterium]
MITEGQVMDIAREALFLIIKVSAPLLLISLVIGLIVSIFQTITSIQEQTLTFVPKILLVFIGMMLLGGWMLENLTSFITDLWSDFGVYLR